MLPIALIEIAINKALAFDPEVLTKISALQGKIIALEIENFAETIYLHPTRNGFQLTNQSEIKADVILRGSLFALFKMSTTEDATHLMLKKQISIEGDVKLGHQLKTILSSLEIDGAAPLSNIVGESLANPLFEIIKKTTKWGQQSIHSLSLDMSEYLQEESRDVITESELSMFNRKVDDIKNDVERIDAKINTLKIINKKQ